MAAALERRALSSLSHSSGSGSRDMFGAFAAAQAEERGSMLGVFRERLAPSFFAGLDDRDATLAMLRRLAPDAEAGVVERARAAARGRFSFLGQKELSFGDPIDWWLDPVAGRRAPARHWSRIPYLDPTVVGDHKLVWELNRHQHFVTLGQAYWYTGDEMFAGAFATQLAAWLDFNPPKLGINWASSLEVSFRSISWLWALHFFRRSSALTPALFDRTIASLDVHGRHLETFLSTYFSPNTHLTGEALGLYYLGTLLPELRAASRWRALGAEILTQQMARQVRTDGVYFEQATCYQKYTTEFCLHVLLLAQRQADECAATGAALEPITVSLLECLMMLRRPDGRLPLLGDDDGGQLVLLDDRGVCDVRATLGVGAGLFRRPDFRQAAGDPGAAAVWLLGPDVASQMFAMPQQQPRSRSHAFHAGGWFVMRDRWTPDASYLVVNCGPHGANGAGHAHADALACEIVSHGRAMVVDPGTFTYTTDREVRDRFRRTSAHNALTLDGVSSSEPHGPFRWRRAADARLDRWVCRDRFDFFSGHHDGFQHLPGAPVVRRSILFIRGDYWVLRDQVESTDAHWVRVGYQCAADVAVIRCSERNVELRAPDGAGLVLTALSDSGHFRVADGNVSSSYGSAAAAPRIEFVLQAPAGADIITVITPLTAAACGRTIEEIKGDATAPRSLRIAADQYTDTVIVGAGRTAGITTDAEWTWVRRDARDDRVREVAVIRGRRVEVDGAHALAVAVGCEPVDYALRHDDPGALLDQPAMSLLTTAGG